MEETKRNLIILGAVIVVMFGSSIGAIFAARASGAGIGIVIMACVVLAIVLGYAAVFGALYLVARRENAKAKETREIKNGGSHAINIGSFLSDLKKDNN